MSGTVRVIPLLVVAGLCLFVLKSLGLVLSGGYVISGVAPASAQNPEANAVPEAPAPSADQQGEPKAEMQEDGAQPAAEPESLGAGETETMENNAGASEAMPDKKMAMPEQTAGTEPPAGTTKSELAVLEGLANRRKALDQRERQIDLRENLLRAAEKRVEARIDELKSIQAKIESELKKRDDHRKAQYERLVTMYSKMKPKDAARVFNNLELDVLTGIVSQMKPRIMSSILAEMAPASAQRLTLEIASQSKPAAQTAESLPQIEGKATN